MTPRTFDLATGPLEGRNLVEASAGTGKTFTLAGLFVRLLLEARLTVDQILVVTFTEAATEELRGRIRERLRAALDAFRSGASGDDFLRELLSRLPAAEEARLRLAEALRCFDEAAIFTIHGFCQRVLQEKAFECGSPFDAELATDERTLLQEVADDFWRRELFGASPALISHLRRRKITPESLASLLTPQARVPDVIVLPEEEGPGADDLEARCRAEVRAVRDLWPASKEEVASVLATHPALKRTIYKPASVPGWVAAMDQHLCSPDPFEPFDTLSKFCTASLRGDPKKGQEPPDHLFFDACQALHEVRESLERDLERQVTALRARFVRHAREELPRRKAERNLRSFDDLLGAVRRAVGGDPGGGLARALRERYPAALIDEFQDTDPVQYAIFRSLYPDERCRLFLIGDPKQAIYGFRGADVFAYLDALGRVDHRWTLGLNWRSVPPLIRAVNAVFENAPRPFVLEQIPFYPVAPAPKEDHRLLVLDGSEDRQPLQLWFAGRDGDRPIGKGTAERTLPAAVAGEILRLLEAASRGGARLGDRPLEPGDMAVLVRTNRQARRVKDALEELGIPGVLYSSESLFTSLEAEEMLRVLAAAAEPRNESRRRAALVTDLLGLTGSDLARLARDEGEWDGRAQRFARYHELWSERGFVVMARALLAEERVRERLLPLPDGERRLTNVLHCVEVLQHAATEGKLGPEGLVHWLGRRIEERNDEEEYQLRLETDERAVKVVTVHKSKGLEYPVVFCPFAWEGAREQKQGPVVFHTPEAPLRLALDLGSERQEDHRRLAEQEALAESLRLLYVALTRARNRCYVVWGAFNGAETSALAHVLHPAPPSISSKLPPDAQLLDQLTALSERTGRALRASQLPPPAPSGARYAPVSAGPEPACRSFRGRIPADWGVASFSSLASGRDEAAEFPDRDERRPERPEEDRRGSPAARTIFDFPRGVQAGNCLHAVMEELDYGAERAAVEALVRRKLEAHGFEARWAGPVAETLGQVCGAILDPADPGLRLSRLTRADRVNELEFYLPLSGLTPQALRRVFELPGLPPGSESLGALLGELEFRPIRGHLKGFVDLVFQWGGRYFIADWKSNHLGDRPQDYGPEGLQRAVDEHLYALQYHLYVAALHRHLSARLPGYDYERHFGGIFYVFLRGVDPEIPGSGIHRARPTRALVEALCACIREGELRTEQP